jgi:hypothetical protein
MVEHRRRDAVERLLRRGRVSGGEELTEEKALLDLQHGAGNRAVSDAVASLHGQGAETTPPPRVASPGLRLLDALRATPVPVQRAFAFDEDELAKMIRKESPTELVTGAVKLAPSEKVFKKWGDRPEELAAGAGKIAPPEATRKNLPGAAELAAGTLKEAPAPGAFPKLPTPEAFPKLPIPGAFPKLGTPEVEEVPWAPEPEAVVTKALKYEREEEELPRLM